MAVCEAPPHVRRQSSPAAGRVDGNLSSRTAATGGTGSLADFRELKMLGEGAFSAVYKVVRLADNEIYALKKVKLPSLSDKEKQNALNEIRLLASVRHDNVISYKDAFFDDKTRCLCIVTECADGGDLLQQINTAQKKRTHLKEADIWRYLIGLADGLQALHSMRILHRDMKSANVFISTAGGRPVAKLGDFNVSTVAKRGLCITQTGTPYYASPEVWRDMPYDGKSDMWSLGCVIYEACALKPPFRAKDMEGLYRRVLRGEYQRIPEHFSNELHDVISAMMQVNPRYRPSAEQLLQLPVVRRKAAELDIAVGASGASDLLQTIKVPRKLIDLSSCLPRPQYADKLDAAVAAAALKLGCPVERPGIREECSEDGRKGLGRRSTKARDDARSEDVEPDRHEEVKLRLPALAADRLPASQQLHQQEPPQDQHPHRQPSQGPCEHRDRSIKAGHRRRPGSRSGGSLVSHRKQRQADGGHGGGNARLPPIVSHAGRL